MTNPDDDIATIIQILKENTSYSPQAQVYVIHGAIQKLIEWKNSLINTNQMQTMTMPEQARLIPLVAERPEICVIMHSHNVWKGTFFTSPGQAAGVLKAAYPEIIFIADGRILTNSATGARYYIRTLDAYSSMNEITHH